jgi:hypothetical protein
MDSRSVSITPTGSFQSDGPYSPASHASSASPSVASFPQGFGNAAATSSLFPSMSSITPAADVVAGLEVSDYALSGDPNFYDSHIFIIKIWVAQDMYTIERSYSHFCMFDARLRKKYSRTELPALPLNGANLFVGRMIKKEKGKDKDKDKQQARKQEVGAIRKSLYFVVDSASGNAKDLVKRADTSEIIAQKKGALSDYLNKLANLPLIAISSDFQDFLDEESPDGMEFERAELSEIDLILQDEDSVQKTVSSTFSIPLNLDTGSVVVWRFQTKHKDIGFSVEFRGQQVSSYQRYNSHQVPVGGIFEAPVPDRVVLLWDNSYSKMTSKVLVYTVKVISKSDFEAARQELEDTAKMRHLYDIRRAALRQYMTKLSEEGLGSGSDGDGGKDGGVHAAAYIKSGSASTTGVSALLLSQYQQEIHRLQDENRMLQMRLSTAEFSLHERSDEADTLREQVERLQEARDTASEKYSNLLMMFDENSRIVEYEKSLRIQQEETYANEIQQLKHEHSNAISALQEEVHQLNDDKFHLESKVAQLKAEKKQLKALALKFKGDLEESARAVDSLSSEKAVLQRDLEAANKELDQLDFASETAAAALAETKMGACKKIKTSGPRAPSAIDAGRAAGLKEAPSQTNNAVAVLSIKSEDPADTSTAGNDSENGSSGSANANPVRMDRAISKTDTPMKDAGVVMMQAMKRSVSSATESLLPKKQTPAPSPEKKIKAKRSALNTDELFLEKTFGF